LFALLDESKARVRMLIAPAGYGKTTLAEQWVARDGRRAAWFTARSSSTDVAALALGVAQSATSIVEDCDVRLRAHMRALPAPADNVETLAEILGEDLGAWPSNTWLVIDDYHEVAQEPRAEDFVKALVAASSAQFLIASRVRPSWISTKDLMYGDAFEVNQAALAMDNREAADVLVGRSARSASGLVLLANGWPAVIGLASVSSAEIEDEADQVPESLYRFFAEEVFASLGTDVRQGMTTLSVAPALDRELAGALLGLDASTAVVASALDVGILVERGQQLDVHPLARAFLREKGRQLGLVPADNAVETCLAHYRVRREWDAAFDTAVRSASVVQLESLMHEGLDELLDTGRLQTVQKWTDAAASVGVSAPILSLARSEVALRGGRHVEAISNAEAAAARDARLAYRAMSVAGRAAHLASREDDALAFFGRAGEAAASDSQRRDALWGAMGCLIDLEDPSAHASLARLSEEVTLGQPREFVRAAAYLIGLQIRLGSLDLEQADMARDVLSAVDDPLVESSFLNGYAFALALTARYEEALSVAEMLSDVAQRYRLEFALPYALCASATAHSGLRQWESATVNVREALLLARQSRDTHVEHLGNSLLLRILAQQGLHGAALDLRIAEPRGALKASRSELLCSLALVTACSGRIGEALDLVDRSRGLTNAVETRVLVSAVDAICALKTGSSEMFECVASLADTAVTTGGLDLLVVSYRACPELLPVLLRTARTQEVERLLLQVGDTDLASAVGHPITMGDDRRARLSSREREVYDLLCEGLTNRQIAKTLFIETSTVKVHAHHIYDKLGVRSRTALAVHALLERSGQATSATESKASDCDSS
jgi:DNA-binding CsgD family transcriptional regulator